MSIFEDLCSTLHILGPVKYSRFLLLGDFNVDFCNEDCYLFSYITDILFLFSLTQVVPSYTHVSPNGNTSLIDLALLSDTNDLNHCCTIPPLSNSDLGITISLKWIANTKHYSKSRCVWLYGNADFNKACHIINATDWNSIITDEINKSTEQWTEKFLSIMEECIPRANIYQTKKIFALDYNKYY